MEYRREIDGLRALAVLSVILAHAGVEIFSGGFVGVDIFFVISGYLITTIILNELEKDEFEIVKFYERRARRILPALFLVMFISTIFGYLLLMPDEYKNLGQSLVATSIFSNNILLGITSGYWDLASEFKPLLHTWSLGVEEQYYIFYPILILLAWKFNQKIIPLLLWISFIISISFAIWFVSISPSWSFYLLPTRAWELVIGGITVLFMRSRPNISENFLVSNIFSFLGFLAIITSVIFFDETTPAPSYPFLLPTIGAVLIIIFSQPKTLTYHILSHKWMVFTGLISYSLYLWHQPFFAYLRAYSKEEPSVTAFLALIPIIFIISYLTWMYIESPFRNKKLINRKTIFTFSILGNLFFIIIGLYLNQSYGMSNRAFTPDVTKDDMDKRIYNHKAYNFKSDAFSDSGKTKILIIGNSFARDFVNITTETFDIGNHEIIYRPYLKHCILPYDNVLSEKLYSKADVIVFSSGGFDKNCLAQDIEYAKNNGKDIFYIGTKYFGYNLNWVIRLDEEEKANRYNTITDSIIKSDMEMEATIPAENYISLLKPILVENTVPITDELGRMISTDRVHLTKYGAIYLGKKAIIGSKYADIFKQ
jgi:peptidoglycan/LPS O-acetylase OafA/YrhL